MPDPQQNGYRITTDPQQLDITAIHDFLSNQSYWARGRSLETVQRSIENSLCFGVLAPDGQQVGFARVVTDYATFAWLCDVYVLESERGKGLGKWLVQSVVAHPLLQGLRNFILSTRDAHELYRKYGGFEALADPGRWMSRPRPKA
jgi:GNAT superfamily N-acetyltransferase